MTLQINLPINAGKNPPGTKKAKPKKKEEALQMQVARYLRTQYPGTIFNSDLASGMKLTIGQAGRAKMMRSGRGQPDMIILAPSKVEISPGHPMYYAMCLELKNSRSDVYKSDGTISESRSKEHVREQFKMLSELRGMGYWADFGFGFEDCKKKIDDYFSS